MEVILGVVAVSHRKLTISPDRVASTPNILNITQKSVVSPQRHPP
jgi:hypothetical protein